MGKVHIIEEYLNGGLNGLSSKFFDIILKNSKKLRKEINIYKDIDRVLKVPILVANAELEMCNQKIDELANGYVAEWVENRVDKNDITVFLNLSLL